MDFIINLLPYALIVGFFMVYKFCFSYVVMIEKILGFILWPVDKLTDLVLRREYGIPGTKILRFVILGIVMVVSGVYIVNSLFIQNKFDSISDLMLSSTSVGQLLAFFGESRFGSTIKDQFTFSSLVSMGVTSFISFLFMRCTIETVEDFELPAVVNIALIILFNLAFICISALLSTQIEGLCLVAGDKLQSARLALSDLYHLGMEGFGNSLKVIFSGFLLFLMYAGFVYLLVVTFREVVATFLYGFMSFVFLALLVLFWELVENIFPGAPGWLISVFRVLVQITVPVSMFLPDYIRATDGVDSPLLSVFFD